jgi:alanyl-tRNA synthetase
MWKLVPTLVREMGAAYPELARAQDLITETLRLEESRFRRTLERGLRILDDESGSLGKGDTFSGETAFKLYDTYGFPLDLTQDALKPRGIQVDTTAFNAAMEAQREEARRAWKGSGEAKTETIWFEIRERYGATEFLGYDTETAEGIVRALIADGKEVEELKAGQKGSIVLNQTPFYGESGGQTGDQGVIKTPEGAVFRVTDTQKRVGDVYVHIGQVEQGTITPGNAAELIVDHTRRSGNRIHHSATHLVHEALRITLGSHVAQKGSLVEPNRLRFDFSHNKAMSSDEIAQVEALSNEIVLQNDQVTTRLMSVDAAIAEGAMALFGEKYGDEVRVVAMGRNTHGAGRPVYSLELCGGTHVSRTGDIGLIKIVSESASAAGVRRVEALAGPAARAYLEEQDRRVQAVAAALRTTPGDVVPRIESLIEERRKLERELAETKKALALGGGAKGDDGVTDINGVKLMARILKGIDPKDMKGLVDEGKAKLGSGVVALVGLNDEGRAGLIVGVTNDLTSRFNAVDLVRTGSTVLGGKGGGGRPDMAQAGGPDASKAQEALDAIRAALAA